MKFTQNLIDRTRIYLSTKLDKQPEDDVVILFLCDIAQLGHLLIRNSESILKDE